MTENIFSVNVAIGKPASQSSVSPWSKDNDAAGAVTGVMPTSFGFHTAHETAPWWMVDLLKVYPIDRIVLHNRLDGCQERARSCLVDVSEDGVTWLLIHSGTAHFLGGDAGAPLTLPLAGQVAARYVRVSLTEANALHLAQVEVFSANGYDIKRQTGLTGLVIAGEYPARPASHFTYRLERKGGQAGGNKLIGFRITNIGRLGNQLIQLAQAICVARRLGVKYIVVLQQGMIRLAERFSHDGIEFIANIADAGEDGVFLTGNFFYRHQLSPLIDQASDEEQYRVVHDIIIPRLLKPLPDTVDVKYPDELTVHFRAGDIFSGNAIHAKYVQPPLAFYKLVVRRLAALQRISRVRLVYEDRGNPCVDGFIEFLDSIGMPYRAQSSTLGEDLAALVDSPLLAVGYGTFGTAVALLSRRIETVFCFESRHEVDYATVYSVGNVITVLDRAGGYIKPSAWRNTLEQRQMMLDYPEDALEIAGEVL